MSIESICESLIDEGYNHCEVISILIRFYNDELDHIPKTDLSCLIGNIYKTRKLKNMSQPELNITDNNIYKEVDMGLGLGTIESGTVNVIAARPCMGKTSLALSIALHSIENKYCHIAYISKLGKSVLYKQLRNMVSNSENIYAYDIYRIIINDYRYITLDEIKSFISEESKKGDMALIIIDDIDNIHIENKNNNDRLKIIFKSLLLLAEKYSVPVLITANVKMAHGRDDPRPILTDIDHYRNYERNTSKFIYLYRDEIYNPETQDKDQVEVRIESREFRNDFLTRLVTNKEMSVLKEYTPEDH